MRLARTGLAGPVLAMPERGTRASPSSEPPPVPDRALEASIGISTVTPLPGAVIPIDEILAVYDYDGANAARAIVLSEAAGPDEFRVAVGSGAGIRVLWRLEIRPPRAYPPLCRTELVEKG